MTDIYKPYSRYDELFDESRCKTSVRWRDRGVGFHQCTRRPWKDGWCRQHHPDTVKEREAEKDKRYREQRANSLPVRYDRLGEQYNTLIGLLSNALDGNAEAMKAVRKIMKEGMK